MKITLRLFATLRTYAPPGANDGEAEIEVPKGVTPCKVIEQLGIPRELASLVMIDGYHQTRSQVETRTLKKGETLAIVPPIAGG